MAINISYQDTTLATFTSGSKVLKTAGKYLADDITIESLLANGEYMRIPVIPEQTVTTVNMTDTNLGLNRNLALNLNKIETLIPGEHYIITFNGTEYVSECQEMTAWSEYHEKILGTPQWVIDYTQVHDYIYPFAIDDNATNTELATPSVGQYTIQVDRLVFSSSSSSIIIPKTITANGIYDPSDDDADGYGVVTVNVSGGGGGASPAATQHTIHLEFTDSTNTNINLYYDDSFINSIITSFQPTTYGQKIVDTASLDNTIWYTSDSNSWETVYDGVCNWYPDDNNDYPYCWLSSLAEVEIPVGSIWRVTYNNLVYTLTGMYNSVEEDYYIGNTKWAGGADNNVDAPFVLGPTPWDAWSGSANESNEEPDWSYLKIERYIAS